MELIARISSLNNGARKYTVALHISVTRSHFFANGLHSQFAYLGEISKRRFLGPDSDHLRRFHNQLGLAILHTGVLLTNDFKHPIQQLRKSQREGGRERAGGQVHIWSWKLLPTPWTKQKRNRPLRTCSLCQSLPRGRNPTPKLRLAVPPHSHLLWPTNAKGRLAYIALETAKNSKHYFVESKQFWNDRHTCIRVIQCIWTSHCGQLLLPCDAKMFAINLCDLSCSESSVMRHTLLTRSAIGAMPHERCLQAARIP